MESRQSRIEWAFKSAKRQLSADSILGFLCEYPKSSFAAAAITLTLFMSSNIDGPITRDVFFHANAEATQAHIDEANQLLGKTSRFGLAKLSQRGVASHDCVIWVTGWGKKGLLERKVPELVSLDPESMDWGVGVVPHLTLVNNVTCQFHMPIPKALPALRRVAKQYPLKQP